MLTYPAWLSGDQDKDAGFRICWGSREGLRTKDGGVICIRDACETVDAREHPLCMVLEVQDGFRVFVEVIAVCDA